MKGDMTAFYTGDDEQMVHNYLFYHLAVEINSQRVLIGTIEQAFFIGASVSEAGIAQGGDIGTVDGDNRSTSSIIPLVMSVPIAVVAFLAIFAIVIGRRRRNQVIVIGETRDECENDSIIPLYEQKDSITPVVTSPDFELGQEQNYHGDETVEPRSGSPNLLLDLEADHHPITTNALVQQELSRTSGDYPPIAGQQRIASMMLVDLLPPLAPGGPSAKTAAAKQPLKRRRRRKKVKKRPTVARVNSRENVKEMETIEEAADERGSDEDDSGEGSGSEYSWSTDETDSRPNSREASPVRGGRQRSPSPGPSRHRSPSPGPPRHITPPPGRPRQADPSPPVPFVTGNFAQGFMTPENVWTDSGNAQVSNMPSPIQEEPKIKPLPPPWV
jgi:hypothetical protein